MGALWVGGASTTTPGDLGSGKPSKTGRAPSLPGSACGPPIAFGGPGCSAVGASASVAGQPLTHLGATGLSTDLIGRRCRRGHHGTNRTTHVRPRQDIGRRGRQRSRTSNCYRIRGVDARRGLAHGARTPASWRPASRSALTRGGAPGVVVSARGNTRAAALPHRAAGLPPPLSVPSWAGRLIGGSLLVMPPGPERATPAPPPWEPFVLSRDGRPRTLGGRRRSPDGPLGIGQMLFVPVTRMADRRSRCGSTHLMRRRRESPPRWRRSSTRWACLRSPSCRKSASAVRSDWSSGSRKPADRPPAADRTRGHG